MGLGSLLKNAASGGSQSLPTGTDASTKDQPPSKRQIYHSRFNHGPNLGAWFVNEKWICDCLHDKCSKGGSELDAVQSVVKSSSVGDANKKWLEHYNNWITDSDWDWMKSKGVTAVRVPIGYWMVDDGSFTKHTEFSKYADVYKGAWNILKDNIKKADQRGIAVLVDLHALPGGANDQEHSGSSCGKALLWDSSSNKDLSSKILSFVAKDLKSFDNICGIQILNEAPYCHEGHYQERFYASAAKAIREVNEDVPIVISDGWDLGKFVSFVESSISKHREHPQVIIDTHVYRCFSQDDCKKSAPELINGIDSAISDVPPQVDVLVGEFSCVLSEDSWKGQDRNRLVKEYGNKEVQRFSQVARGGYYFWTYKFEHGSGGEWGFREMTDVGALPTYSSESFNKGDDEANKAYEEKKKTALDNHKGYWEGQNPKQDWEFWRFEQGYWYGWNDSLGFAKFNNSELGRLGAWKLSREAQHVAAHGDSNMLWNFQHGFDQGMQDFINWK